MRRRASGFTLLEVMVALAIVASSLVVLLEIATNNVRATNHAKLMTTATFLARAKMVSVEKDILEIGFGDTDLEDAGTFEDNGFPQFRWTTLIERVELPTNAAQAAQTQASTQAQDTHDPMQVMQGFVGGLMSAFIDPIRLGLEASVRRVTLMVYWNEVGRGEQKLDLVTFLADPSKLDAAIGMGASASAGAPATGAAAGGASTSGAGSSSTTGAGSSGASGSGTSGSGMSGARNVGAGSGGGR